MEYISGILERDYTKTEIDFHAEHPHRWIYYAVITSDELEEYDTGYDKGYKINAVTKQAEPIAICIFKSEYEKTPDLIFLSGMIVACYRSGGYWYYYDMKPDIHLAALTQKEKNDLMEFLMVRRNINLRGAFVVMNNFVDLSQIEREIYFDTFIKRTN